MNRTVDMTRGNPVKHILSFAFPLLLTNLGQQLYMIVDAAIVGRGVGMKALAAVGATDWTYWLVLWTVIGLTQGFATFVSRSFGDKNYGEMNRVIAMSTLLSAASGIVMTVAGIAASAPLLQLLKTPADILGDAHTYLVTMISGILVVTAYNMASSILRALGDGKTPLIAMVIAALLNVGLDCLFVFLFGWGIFGAAIASVLSQLVAFLYCLFRIFAVDCIKIDRKMWKPDWKLIRQMLLFGAPICLQYMTISIGGILLQSAVNLQGSIFIAGYTATNKVFGLFEASGTSLGLAAATFLGQNYGAGLYDRVRQGVKTASVIAVISGIIVFVIMYLVRYPLLQFFLDVREDGAVQALEVAVRYLIVMILFLIVLYLIHVFRNALQAMEVSLWSLLSGIAECICRMFMAKVVIHWIGSDALFFSEPLAWFSALLCVVLPYFYYRAKRLK
ncbi:MAG: MATE family efflux transporter [Ruminococcaceae bacterium]|nr:MATE family efflux transporter [Oscillospiraceae bacterium]